jgi:hypothetical protein
MAATLTNDAGRARTRAADYFRGRQSRQGVLARRLLGEEDAGDGQLVEHLISERRRKTKMDGGIDHSLVQTAWAAWELMQLGTPADHAGVVRMIGYVLGRQNRPGRFRDEGPEGFFSPAAPDDAVAPLAFPSGLVITAEADARFAASCFALRTVLRAGQDRRPAVQQHVESLVTLPDLWQTWGTPYAGDLVFFALGALALASFEYRERTDQAIDFAVRQQQPDGSWAGASLIHAVDMLLTAPKAAARDAIVKALPKLLREEGDPFAPEADEERALIVLRALLLDA